MKRLFCLLSLVSVVVAACGGGDSAPAPGGLVQWDRSPNTVVYRSDVEGGTPTNAFLARNDVPACTLYGDNRVVWTNEVGPFNVQVLWDKVSDEQVTNFVLLLTNNYQFYNYQERAQLEPASATQPVVETMLLNVNGRAHKTDAFSGWTLDYYQGILDTCRQVSAAPVLFEPTAAWVSAEAVPYDTTAPIVAWDGAANGLVLQELAASGERKWITDRNVPVLWNIIRSSPPNIQFLEGESQYHIALEVPNVTREAPPAPG